MIEEIYKYPYSVFKKYFPNGTEKEFDDAFVSFDVSEKEFHQLTDDTKGDYVCLDTVIFDLTKIKSQFDYLYIKSLKNKFKI